MEQKHSDNIIDSDLNNINIKELCITIERKENLTKDEIDNYFLKITNTFLKISTIQSTLDKIKNNLFSQLNLLESINSSLKNQEDNFDILNENNKNDKKNSVKKEINKEVKKRGRKKNEVNEKNDEKKEVKKRGRKKKVNLEE